METKTFEIIGRELRDAVLRLLRDYSESLALAVLIAVIVRFFVFAAFRISTPAMEPSVKVGDFILGYKLPFGLHLPFTEAKLGKTSPKRWDMVLFRCPQKTDTMCLRRVVGVAGDRIEVRKKRLMVNGRLAKYKKSQVEPSESLIAKVPFIALDETWGRRTNSILISADETTNDFGPFIVPPGAFFAMGDNRDFTEDSRHWGAIPVSSIEAKAVMVWMSIEWLQGADGMESEVRWDRLFQRLN